MYLQKVIATLLFVSPLLIMGGLFAIHAIRDIVQIEKARKAEALRREGEG